MDIKEVRQKILEKDPVFGKKCLDYFDSLHLEDVSVPFSIPNEATIAIKGRKSVDRKPGSRSSLTDFIYTVGFVTSKACCFGIELGSYNQKRSPYLVFLTEKDGIIPSAMPLSLGAISYIPQERLQEDLTFLEELIKTRNGLGLR